MLSPTTAHSPTIAQLKSKLAPQPRYGQPVPPAGQPVEAIRRSAHGSLAWSIPGPGHDLYQPQDGAFRHAGRDTDAVGRVAGILSRLRRPLSCEPEDARITGATRSLKRRLSGLNVRTASTQPALNTRRVA